MALDRPPDPVSASLAITHTLQGPLRACEGLRVGEGEDRCWGLTLNRVLIFGALYHQSLSGALGGGTVSTSGPGAGLLLAR